MVIKNLRCDSKNFKVVFDADLNILLRKNNSNLEHVYLAFCTDFIQSKDNGWSIQEPKWEDYKRVKIHFSCMSLNDLTIGHTYGDVAAVAILDSPTAGNILWFENFKKEKPMNRSLEDIFKELCELREVLEPRRFREEIFNFIDEEREKQDEKWGEQNHSFCQWVTILSEEIGEVAKAACEFELQSDCSKLENYKEELIQSAAVIVAMLECLERNEDV